MRVTTDCGGKQNGRFRALPATILPLVQMSSLGFNWGEQGVADD
jgi:hypothetical protein